MSRLLIVSSSDLELDLGQTVLWRPGVQRAYVAEKEAAIEAARTLRPNVVLTDSAHSASTVSLIRRLREDPETCSTAFVVLNRSSSLVSAEDLRQAGADAVVTPPVDPFQWDARLERLLNVPRRRHARIPVLLDVWSRLAVTTPFLRGVALNISVRGILLLTEESLLTGAKLDLTFALPKDNVELHVVGQVARQAGHVDGHHATGIEFLVLLDDARQRINRFVESSLWPRTEPTGGETVTQLVVERREWESELRATEARKTAIVESAPDGIVTTDPEGRIIEFNRAAEQILGYKRAEVLGRSVERTIVPSTMRDHYRRLLDSYPTADGAPLPGTPQETTGCRADGSEFPMELVVTPIQLRDRRLLTFFLRDITERKRAEEERARLEARMQHAQKLESLGVMAGGVAHDFNNMLVGMLGHSSVALTKLPPESPAHRNIKSVAAAAQRAADLCRQMLAYSGRGHFLLRPADLNDLVRENLRLLEAAVPKNVRLEAQLSEEPTSIKADLGQMQQLIMNLVLNGSDAIGKEVGSVTVTTGFEVVSDEDGRYSRFTASKVEPGRYVFLEVRDDGCGMDEGTLSNIFDPFFTTNFVGRGLGLAAVLGIVRGHQGGIDIESELGRGTAFRLLLPELEDTATAVLTTTDAMTSGSLEQTVLQKPYGVDALRAEIGRCRPGTATGSVPRPPASAGGAPRG